VEAGSKKVSLAAGRRYGGLILRNPLSEFFNPSGKGAILVSQIVPRFFYVLNSTPSFNPKPIEFSQNFCYNAVTFPPTFRGGVRGGYAASAVLIGGDMKTIVSHARGMISNPKLTQTKNYYDAISRAGKPAQKT